jgi:hypothetical protein
MKYGYYTPSGIFKCVKKYSEDTPLNDIINDIIDRCFYIDLKFAIASSIYKYINSIMSVLSSFITLFLIYGNRQGFITVTILIIYLFLLVVILINAICAKVHLTSELSTTKIIIITDTLENYSKWEDMDKTSKQLVVDRIANQVGLNKIKRYEK